MELYGRLDVYWPDGPVESFPLEKPDIAVGRQVGNDIVLDTTTVSRYHVRISHEDGQVFVTDLDTVNGTYVDGTRLLPNEPRLLKGGEEVQIGDVRAVYQPTLSDEMPTAVAEQGVTVAVTDVLAPERKFAVHLESGVLTVTPGAHNQIHIDIQNLSDAEKQFLLTVEGVPNGWARFDRARVTLDPGEKMPISLLVKPTRRSDSLPGDYPLTIHVAEENTDQAVSQALLLRVRDFVGFGIAFSQPKATADGRFEIYVHNQGNAPLTTTFTGTDKAGLFIITLEPPILTLKAGERSIVRGQIRLRQRNWSLRSQTHRFDVIAQSQDNAHFLTPITGTYDVLPQFTGWGWPVVAPIAIGAAVLLILAVCATLALTTVLRPAATPTPEASATVLIAPLTPFTPVPLPTSIVADTSIPPTEAIIPSLVLPTSSTLFALSTLPAMTDTPFPLLTQLPTDIPANIPAAIPPLISPSPSIGG